jgi:hypothetical protein
MLSTLILEGIAKAIKKMVDEKAKLNQEIVLVDAQGKPYRVRAKDIKANEK